MKHTKEQITANVLKALKDVRFPYDVEKGIYSLYFIEDEKPLRGPKRGQPIPAWHASVEFEMFSDREPLFITIPDETGEPIYLQHSTAVIEIGKDKEGIYFRK